MSGNFLKNRDINFWASVATIFSVFLALWIFMHDDCLTKKLEQQTYISQLETIKLELNKSLNEITPKFERDRDLMSSGLYRPFQRYSTITMDLVIAEGVLRNRTVADHLFAIHHNIVQMNKILDSMEDIAILVSVFSPTSPSQDTQQNLKTLSSKFFEFIDGGIDVAGNVYLGLPKSLKDSITEIADEQIKVSQENLPFYCAIA